MIIGMAHINICVEPPLKRAAVAYRPFLDGSLPSVGAMSRKIVALAKQLYLRIPRSERELLTAFGQARERPRQNQISTGQDGPCSPGGST